MTASTGDYTPSARSQRAPDLPGGLPGGVYHRGVPDAEPRGDAVADWAAEARGCTRCSQLAAVRARVVVGAGRPDADLLLVAGAPDREEEREGRPLVGRAGALLDELLAAIGLRREDVFLTYAVMCRPPDNRDPTGEELARCREHLVRQIAMVEPRVVCPLGNVATRVLRGDPAPVTRVRGHAEVAAAGGRAFHLYPLLHPAAALYRRETVDALRADVGRLPALLAKPLPPRRSGDAPHAGAAEPETAAPATGPAAAGQLELF